MDLPLKKIVSRFFGSYILLNIPKLVGLSISLLTLPIIISAIQLKEYGMVQFTFAIGAVVSTIAGTRISIAAKHDLVNNKDWAFLHCFIKRWQIFSLPGLALLFLLVYLLDLAPNPENQKLITTTMIIVIYALFGNIFESSYFEYLVAKEKFRQWMVAQSIFISVPLFISALTAYIFHDTILFVATFILAQFAIIVSLWIHLVIREQLYKKYKNSSADNRCLSYGLVMTMSDIVAILSDRAIVLLSAPLFGYGPTAVLSVSQKMRDGSAGLIKSISPLVYAPMVTIQKEQLKAYIKKYGAATLMLGICFTGIIAIAGTIYISFFLPLEVRPAITYFLIMISPFPLGIIGIIMHTFLDSHLESRKLITLGIIANTLSIGVILAMGALFGVIGLPIALAIDGFVVFLSYYIVVHKFL